MGSTHKTIYMPDISSIRVPLPPVGEQDQLVEWAWRELDRTDRMVAALDSQTQLLADHRRALAGEVIREVRAA